MTCSPFSTLDVRAQSPSTRAILSDRYIKVAGIGQVICWTFLDENQHRIKIPLTCLYVPEATTRLLPPQQLSERNEASTANGSWIGYGGSALVFHKGSCIKFPYHKGSNQPVAKLAPGITKFMVFASTSNDLSRTDNLSPASRKLLRLHHRLGHKGFNELQQWAANGLHGIPADIANHPIPVC
jgi:hypothetical protein